ncbi:MAG: ABC transporter permease subunit [Acidimicrobiales bacterium]
MINAFRAEWVRLLRVRTLLAVGVPLILFPALITVLTFAAATGDPGAGPGQHLSVTVAELAAPDGYLAGIDPAATVVGVVVMVFFAVTIGADYAHGTLRNLLVRGPRRTRLLTGRLLALLAFTAGGLVLSVTAAVAAAWIAAPGYDVRTGSWAAVFAESAASWVALVVAAIGWGVVGAALGTALRSVAAAVAAGVVWVLPIEASVSAAWDGGARWLPGAVFDAAAGQGTDALSVSAAVAMVVLYTAIAYMGAVWLLNTRDVLA